ncbi:MAG: helix-turn-helix domain-containing protein [Planctomycetaceae bacterium]
MAKKYLSLEEAASQLGISEDQLKRFREQGEIRGFADRGSWKFREQDIEEFLRSRQTDSSPDFPIITGDSSSSVLDEPESDDLSSSDSDVRLFFDDSMFEDNKEAKELADSGSDVRLTGDSGPKLRIRRRRSARLQRLGWRRDYV